MTEVFVRVEVDPGPAHEDGLSLRFKRAGEALAVRSVPYESDEGLAGRWEAHAVDDPDGLSRGAATAVLVEDSSDGQAWVVLGGRQGLLLVHEDTRATARVPYLLLSASASLR
ncbi:MAG: hypothetical protein HY909_00150 [Deltaproteobacteria bacterium]|nr:hypothetical protein [Deltaproteobacteria bacterium]